jgi:hypothetical protein
VEDTLDEDDETVVVDLDTPTNATLGATTTYSLKIQDDDNAPQVSFNSSESNGSALEGTQPPGPGSIDYIYTVVLTAASGLDVTVPLLYTGTATSGSATTADYFGPASVMIPAGQTSANVTITVNKDSDPETNETIIMTIDATNVVNAGTKTPLSRTHTITNDDT